MTGQTIAHYKIATELGHGGMGQVYRAEDTRLGRQVAIKFLLAKSGEDPHAIERFLREARAASALNHPNIVTVHDLGETSAGRYLVMELVEGKTLRALMTDEVSIDSVIGIGRQVARALAAAHAADIVHRDIKPENIMVRPDGYVKVLDFGVARHMPTNLGDADTLTFSSPGVLVGTYRYMSPEQARARPVSNASDIFSLGTVLFEVATRYHPFAAETAMDVLHRIARGSVVPPCALNPAIPVELETLLLRMLEKSPTLRPTASEVDTLLGLMQDAKGLPVAQASRELETLRRRTIGRQKELLELHSALQSAAAGRGLMLCVAGEPGMGKTTLIEEFLRQVAGAPAAWSIARGRCSERLAGAEGYLPFLEALDTLVRGDPDLTQLLKATASGWHSQVATAASRDSTTGGMLEGAAAAQQRMKRELGVFFQEATRIRPMVLFIDDLHWADLSTVDLLAYLGARLPSMRMLLIGAYRPAELLLQKHPFLPIRQELQAHGICRETALEFLTLEDVNRYLSLEFPNHDFPADLPALIHAKTEGNALFLVDLVRYLSDRRVIGRKGDQPGDRWVLLEPLLRIEREVPESVRSMIQRKIDQIDPVDRRLLGAAALQGSEFDSAVLSKALAMNAVDVEDRLEALERGHALIRRIGESEHPNRTLTLRCGFVHALYQSALYDSLTPARRASMSAGIAEALEEFHGEQKSTVASQLALLLETARDFSRASGYFLLGAQNALRICANQEAAAMARRGIQAVLTLPAGVERTKRELGLQLTLGMASMSASYSSEEAGAALGRARDLCQELGENAKLLGVLGGLHGFYLTRGQNRVALELAEQVLRLAQTVQDPQRLVEAHFILGASLIDMGNPELGLHHSQQAIAGGQSQTARAKPFHNAAIMARCNAARALSFLGRASLALREMEEALTLSKQARHPINYTFALMIAAFLHQHLRDWHKADEYTATMTTLARDNGLLYLMAFGDILEGGALTEKGHPDQSAAQLRKGLSAFEAMGAVVGRTHFLAMLAHALGRADKTQEALATTAEALAGVERTDERYYESEIHRIQGELLARTEDPAAEASLRRAVAVAAAQNAKAFELRASVSLARFLLKKDRREESRDAVAGVYAAFDQTLETRDMLDAHLLLEKLA